MFFLSLAYSLFTCSECSAELGLFSSIGWSYDENFLHLCFISLNSNWGYKGIRSLHIPIWLGINFQWYTSYLFWREIETIFLRHPLEKPSSSKLFNFSVLDGFVAAISKGYPLEFEQTILEFYQQFYSKKWAVEFILQSIKIILEPA